MAIELIDKIKQKNNGNFKLVDAIDVELKDGSDLQNFIDNINDIVDVPSSSECHNVIQGENEPEQDDVIIWVDTSNSENVYSDSLGDKVINEFREIFKYLTNEIKELKAKNLDLEARVSFLEQNGTGGGGNNNPDKPDKPNNPGDSGDSDNPDDSDNPGDSDDSDNQGGSVDSNKPGNVDKPSNQGGSGSNGASSGNINLGDSIFSSRADILSELPRIVLISPL